MNLDLAILKGRKLDVAALRQLRLNPEAMRRQAGKIRERLRNRSVLALTIGFAECAVRLVKREGDDILSAKTLLLPMGAETLLAQPETLGSELLALLNAEGIRERQCVVCLPPAWAFTHSTDVPDLTGEDLRGYLELRAEKEFPMAVSDLRLAHSSFLLPDGRRRVTLAAVPNKRVAAVERMLAKAGCKLVSLSLGLDYLLRQEDARSQVHFLANGQNVDVIITAGGGIAGVRSLPTAVSPKEETFDALGFCREVRIMLGRLPDGVRQGVNEAHFGGHPAAAQALCAKTREHLQRMGIFSPECAPLDAQAPPSSETAASARAAGERFLRDRPAPFEFIAPEVKKWQEWLQKVDSKQRRGLVALAVGLVALVVLVFLIRSHIESNLAEEWAGMRRTVADLEQLQGKVRRFRPWFDSKPQALQALEQLAGAFPDGSDAWAKSIQVQEGVVKCTGFAKSQDAWRGLLDRLSKQPGVSEIKTSQVRGTSPIQFTFSYKWEAKNGL